MSIITRLASALGRRDEEPNIELAKYIAAKKDTVAIKELFENLSNKDIQNDCIKVVYEVGAIQPKMVASHHVELTQLLGHKNNRLQWGAMTALNAIVGEKPEAIFKALPKLVHVAEQGSVITRDHLMAILIKFFSMPAYADAAFVLFNEQLMKSPTNQLPMYAENAMALITEKNKIKFIATLGARLDDIEKDTKRKRVEKVIAKLSKK